MDRLEIVAAGLGFANILLLVRRSVLNYPFGIAMVLLYGWVFAAARLYSDALLQLLFVAVQLYGWWNWRAARGHAEAVPVRHMAARRLLPLLAGTGVAALAWGALMARATDAALPYPDGANAAFSIAAQLLLARRIVENWPVWIGVDALAIGIYLSRGLVATALLYAAMLAMSVAGWRQWHRAAAVGAGA